jgi:hypothetical protein
VPVQNGYEAVQKLRPALLSPRQVASANGQGGMSKRRAPITGTNVSAGQVIVYVDGTRVGDMEQPRQISAWSIATMRLLQRLRSAAQLGIRTPGGVHRSHIETLKRQDQRWLLAAGTGWGLKRPRDALASRGRSCALGDRRDIRSTPPV